MIIEAMIISSVDADRLEVAQTVVHANVVDETCGGHAMIRPTLQAHDARGVGRCDNAQDLQACASTEWRSCPRKTT